MLDCVSDMLPIYDPISFVIFIFTNQEIARIYVSWPVFLFFLVSSEVYKLLRPDAVHAGWTIFVC